MAELDTFYIDRKPKSNGLFLVPTGGSNSLGPGREGHLGSCQDWIGEDCSVSSTSCRELITKRAVSKSGRVLGFNAEFSLFDKTESTMFSLPSIYAFKKLCRIVQSTLEKLPSAVSKVFLLKGMSVSIF